MVNTYENSCRQLMVVLKHTPVVLPVDLETTVPVKAERVREGAKPPSAVSSVDTMSFQPLKRRREVLALVMPVMPQLHVLAAPTAQLSGFAAGMGMKAGTLQLVVVQMVGFSVVRRETTSGLLVAAASENGESATTYKAPASAE